MIKYGRKAPKRQAVDHDLTSNEPPSSSAHRPRKKIKTIVEVVKPLSSAGPENSMLSTSRNRKQHEVKSIDALSAFNKSSSPTQQNNASADHDTHTDEPSSHSSTTTPPLHRHSPSSPSTPKKVPKVTYLSRTPTHPNIAVHSDTSSHLNSPAKPLSAQPTMPADRPYGDGPPTSSSSSILGPLTPKKPAKDLSDLFEFTPRKSTSKDNLLMSGTSTNTGSGIAKRMLSRSRTESSFDTTAGSQSSSKPSFDSLSSSLSQASIIVSEEKSGPSSPSSSPSKQSIPLPMPAPLPVALPSTTTHTRTYAGKSRSFLVSIPASHLSSVPDSAAGAEDPLADESEARESYTDLRTRWGVDNSEDDPYPRNFSASPSPSRSKSPNKGKAKEVVTYANGMTNDLKSITELRSKGESRRFLDEVGYLFEGLEPSSGVGVRRSSALEIVTKLCSPDFARKAKAADFYTRAWDVLYAAGASRTPSSVSAPHDKIVSVLLVFFAAISSTDPATLSELTHKLDSHGRSEFLETLTDLLGSALTEREKDGLALVSAGLGDVELKKAGIARAEKGLLLSLGNIISNKSNIFTSGTPLSTRLLISQSLSALPPALIPAHYLVNIIRTLRDELRLVSPRVAAYISGLSLMPPPSPATHSNIPSFEHLYNCLRMLDSFILGQWQTSDENRTEKYDLVRSRESGLANELVSLCIASELLAQPSYDSHMHDIATKCTEITLRVLLTLTQDDADWCRALLEDDLLMPFIMRTIMKSHDQRSSALSRKHVTDEEDDNDAQVLDRLCLALGLLTNMVQALESAKDKIRKTRIDPTCSGKRNCLQACRCLRHVTALDCLARVYTQQSSGRGDGDPGENFLRGHSAVLLGLLMRDSKPNQKIILSALPESSNRRKLSSLANQAREFVTFYAELATRLSAAATTKKQEDKDSNSDPHSDDNNMDRVVRDGNSEVAKEVVQFLVNLSAQQ